MVCSASIEAACEGGPHGLGHTPAMVMLTSSDISTYGMFIPAIAEQQPAWFLGVSDVARSHD